MTIFRFLCCLVLSVIVSCREVEDDIPIIEGDGGTIVTQVEEDVLILTRENFDLQILKHDIILVEFYAPWCGHCKSLAPEYAKAAKILKDESPSIPLGKVDATVETEIASHYDVSGYPTLILFKKGQHVVFEGPRTAMGIVEYVKERADPNWKPPPTAVLTLTTENFTQTVTAAPIILVEFYAPWCGHCKRLAPEYERAAKALQNLPVPIPLAKIDGTAEKEIADQYEAKGWPTLMIFRNGQNFNYEGPREETGIISYMKEQAKPPSKEVTSANVLKNSFGKVDATIVGFFDSNDNVLYQKFLESANMLRGKFSFFHTFENSVAKHYKVKTPRIMLYRAEQFTSEYEPKKFEFSDNSGTSKDISQFIQDNFLPLVGERSQRNRWQYENKYPLVVVYYDVDFSFDHRVQTQLIRKDVATVAEKYKGKIVFAVSNENDYEDELIQLNLADSGEDVNVGFFEATNVRYRMEPTDDFSAHTLKNFVQNVLAGKVPKHIKSQPIPKDNQGPIVTVVGSTFDDLVIRSKKNIFIEFYAPWCGHCKKLEPIYKKLGKQFAGNDKVMIAKMDATANDYPSQFKVNGFPTIYFVPANDKDNVLTYDQERSLEKLIEFVNRQISEESSKDEL